MNADGITDYHAKQKAENDWRKTVKEGDEVVVWQHQRPKIVKAERCTPTRIRAAGYEFRRDGGRRITTDAYNTVSVGPVTDLVRVTIDRRDAQDDVRAAIESAGAKNWAGATPEQMREIAAMIRKVTQ